MYHQFYSRKAQMNMVLIYFIFQDCLEDWLGLLRLDEYGPNLRSQGYNTILDVTTISIEDLEVNMQHFYLKKRNKYYFSLSCRTPGFIDWDIRNASSWRYGGQKNFSAVNGFSRLHSKPRCLKGLFNPYSDPKNLFRIKTVEK